VPSFGTITEAVQLEFDLLVSWRIVVVVEHVSDEVGRDHQAVPSLVDVLCKLADYWVRCECGKKIKEAGIDGWAKKGLGLGERIDLLNARIPDIESPSRKAAMQTDLEKLEAQSKALNEEWRKAYDEARACEKLFLEAREFCKYTCNVDDDELFNAALVRFRSELLQPGQEPSKRRMSKIKSLLKNLHPDEWKTKPWASPTKPTLMAASRVRPDKLNSFIVQELRSEPGQPAVQSEWPTITKVAQGLGENKGTVSRLISTGKLKDNGLKKTQRRIDPASVLEYCNAKGITYIQT
jgi:hypothetical protein